MFKPLYLLLDRIVVHGTLTVETADGAVHRFGDGGSPRVSMKLADRALERQIALNPNLAVGEGYMDGRLVMREGRIYDLLELVLENAMTQPLPAWASLADNFRYATRRVAQFNPIGRSRRNVEHHYNIDGRVYDLFLDPERQYSCAYFPDSDCDLDEAQRAKIRHIAAKLDLDEEHRLLDIGSGWGGLALNLAAMTGCEARGITLSSEQLAYAERWAAKRGLDQRVQFSLTDYRELNGRFDRVVSVGMFEHVGINHYNRFFERVRDLLTEDGVALIHYIGRADQPAATNAFIARYIFPGGYIPALSEVLPAIERSGLYVTDIEVLRLHYAMTLRRWRERFLARWDEAARLQGERFCRMWEFYLAGSECAFRYQNLVVLQIQLSRRLEALPLVRDYMHTQELAYLERTRALEVARSARLAGE
ncbi:MAG: cyclopropane-fatty-acyl-phospholipid synthase family protein [Hyphomicrobiaceae bacterium]